MEAISYQVLFNEEGSCCDGMLSFTVYGPDYDQTKAWGDQQAWDYIHQKRPNKRALKSLKSAFVNDFLLTEQGPQPLVLDEIRHINRQYKLDDLREFGLGSSGYTGDPLDNRLPSELPPECREPVSLENLREEMARRLPEGSEAKPHMLNNTNWDPNRLALYEFIRISPRHEWRDVTFCRAVNFFHAAVLWRWHWNRQMEPVEPAHFHLANSFIAVGEPLFALRRG